MIRLSARALTPGDATGPIARLDAPLSLWGGLDLTTGAIADVTHPQCGLPLAGRVLAMPAARGSSSSSSALAEAARSGIAPAAIILTRPDPILVIGSLVAADLYGVAIPILLIEPALWASLPDAGTVKVSAEESKATLEFSST